MRERPEVRRDDRERRSGRAAGSAGTLAWGFATTLVVACAWLLGALDFLDAKLLDLSFLLRGRQEAPSQIVLIAIDEDSLAEGQRYPLPRDYLARLVTTVAGGRPRAIMLDVLLDQPGRTQAADDALLAAVREAGNVFLPAAPSVGEHVATVPLEAYRQAAAAVGHISLRVSAADGVVRRFVAGPLPHAPPELPEVSFAALGAAAARGPASDAPSLAQSARGFTGVPLIEFAGPGGTYYALPASDVMRPGAPALLADRLVIIGSVLAESEDAFTSPLAGPDGSRGMSGLEVQANCVATLLALRPITPVGSAGTVLVAIALGVLASVLFPRLPPAWSLAATALAGALLLAVTPALFAAARVYWQGVAPAAAVMAVGAVATARGYLLESARAAVIRGAFSRYLAGDVVDEIIASGDMPQLVGHAREVAVLFCDMHGFSTLSRELAPDVLVAMLSAFFEAMCVPVLRHGGFVDKFVGDEVMAVFGVPYEHADDARRAALTALEMRAALDGFNRSAVARGWPPATIAIGVHCGEVIVGNVGWEGRMDYTVMGETVVLAERLQGLCKQFDTDILVSGRMRAELGPGVRAEPAGTARPRGWDEDIEVYALARACTAEEEAPAARGEVP